MEQPIRIFKRWFEEEISLTKVRIPTAVCLSTNGIDGFPNARFLSFKGIEADAFMITGPINARKGIEIEKNEKVALTFWWTETERQIRVQGKAQRIPEEQADQYFAERNRESQIVSIVSNQGEELKDLKDLEKKFADVDSTFRCTSLKRPKNWGGFSIEPLRMEFLQFKETRFHERLLFTKVNAKWELVQLQP